MSSSQLHADPDIFRTWQMRSVNLVVHVIAEHSDQARTQAMSLLTAQSVHMEFHLSQKACMEMRSEPCVQSGSMA